MPGKVSTMNINFAFTVICFLCLSVVKTKYVVTAQHHTASKQNEHTRRRGAVSDRENKLKPQFSKCDKSSALMKYTTWNIPTIKNRCFSFLSCYCDNRAKHRKGWTDLFTWQFQIKVHHCQEIKATDTWNIRSYYIHLRAENNELLHLFFCSDHFLSRTFLKKWCFQHSGWIFLHQLIELRQFLTVMPKGRLNLHNPSFLFMILPTSYFFSQ